MKGVTGRPAETASAQLTGTREQQEDTLAIRAPVADSGVREGDVLLVLADGMGGHAGGEVASRLVVDSFCTAYHDSTGSVADALRTSLDLANESLARFIAGKPELTGMGSTLLGCVIQAQRLFWISVGDSPLWLYHDVRLQRLNADHSMVPLLEDMVRAGVISPEAARTDPRRSLLRSAVAGKTIALVDLCESPRQLERGDIIMLASDGIETLNEEEITVQLRDTGGLPLDELANKLLSGVESGATTNQDNASLILYRA
jgi:protein phosphatase